MVLGNLWEKSVYVRFALHWLMVIGLSAYHMHRLWIADMVSIWWLAIVAPLFLSYLAARVMFVIIHLPEEISVQNFRENNI